MFLMSYIYRQFKMNIPQSELISVLQEFNPWWSKQPISDLPEWERTASVQIKAWCDNESSNRSLLLSGPRQVGKTTLFRQAIRNLIEQGAEPSQIIYITFDHPLLKLSGIKKTLEAWEELFPGTSDRPQFLFLDEVQFVPDWQVWLKHQVDFQKRRKIAITGSASPLRSGSTESGVGRWETIKLPTLSFKEFLKLRNIEVPPIQELKWTPLLGPKRAALLARPPQTNTIKNRSRIRKQRRTSNVDRRGWCRRSTVFRRRHADQYLHREDEAQSQSHQ